MIKEKFTFMVKDYYRITIKQAKKYWILPVLLLVYLLFFHFVLPNHPNCLIKLLTGFPCPGCGITRSLLAFMRLDFAKAFQFHPLFWLFLLIVFVFIYNERPLINKISKSKIFIITAIFIYLLCYVLRMMYVFPNVPMDPYLGNLLGKFA